MFHIPHNEFPDSVYPFLISTNNKRAVVLLPSRFSTLSAMTQSGLASSLQLPTPQSRLTSVCSSLLKSRKAARKTYGDLVAERELTCLEVAVPRPGLATLDFHELFASESFDLGYRIGFSASSNVLYSSNNIGSSL